MSDIVPAAPSVLVSFLERAARDPEFDVAKFGELLRMQREVEHDQARKAFNRAMADAQSEMLPVVRDATNDHLHNRYARLETIDAAMRPIYTSHGFSVRFGSAPSPREGDIRIICTVAHVAGYFEENHLDAPIGTGMKSATTPVQAVGSAVTYLRRYLLGMVFNIVLANDDDDGEGTRRAAAASTQRPARKVAEDSRWDAPTETPRPRTRKDYLDGLEIALRDARSPEEVDRIVCGEEVMRAKETFQNGHKQRLETLISETLAKWWHTPPDAETPDDGELEIVGADKLAAG